MGWFRDAFDRMRGWCGRFSETEKVAMRIVEGNINGKAPRENTTNISLGARMILWRAVAKILPELAVGPDKTISKKIEDKVYAQVSVVVGEIRKGLGYPNKIEVNNVSGFEEGLREKMSIVIENQTGGENILLVKHVPNSTPHVPTKQDRSLEP